MGYQFQKQSGINQFVIDQTRTVKFDFYRSEYENEMVTQFKDDLLRYGGTAGFLAEEAPSIFGQDHVADAYLLSIQNELE